jgi:hypothetical protein
MGGDVIRCVRARSNGSNAVELMAASLAPGLFQVGLAWRDER